jgi:predicted metal-dependent HD superfamily phosphohydrolase
VQQLTDVEVRKFYAAYRALERKVHKLGRISSVYHEAAIWRELLIAALATFLLVLWIA